MSGLKRKNEVIKLTKYEAQYVLDTIESYRELINEIVIPEFELEYDSPLIASKLEMIDNSDEIIRSCLCNQEVEAYKLEDEYKDDALEGETYSSNDPIG